MTDGTEDPKEESPEIPEVVDKSFVDSLMTKENSKEVVRTACRLVGSLSEEEFEVRFNTDVFQPHVRHAQPEVSNIRM